MITHEDPLRSFIPKKKIKFVILGTMVAINGRIIDGEKPQEPFFYYNNNRNHFWRILQYLTNSKLKKGEHLKKMTLDEKKSLLEEHGIAIINLVHKVTVPNKDKNDPSDTILFYAFKKERLKLKKVPPRVKSILQTKPLFFTCRKKKGIDQLLDGFIKENKLSNIKENIWYWATPTRCNPYKRSLEWKKEMDNFTLGLERNS